MKIGIISLVVIGALFWFFISSNQVRLVTSSPSENTTSEPLLTTPAQPDMSKLPSVETSNTLPAEQHTHTTPSTTNTPTKTHLDHLSPEMKQALKDTLFHHGPKTTTVDSQGRIRMDHNGRYVSMPVAVRKADGSIEIKEYSVVPDTHTETTP